MRWPWSRRRKAEEAEALRAAQERLDDAKRKDAEVNSLADQLRQIRDANHFAEMLAASFRDRR